MHLAVDQWRKPLRRSCASGELFQCIELGPRALLQGQTYSFLNCKNTVVFPKTDQARR
jgi:hypothetical protein